MFGYFKKTIRLCLILFFKLKAVRFKFSCTLSLKAYIYIVVKNSSIRFSNVKLNQINSVSNFLKPGMNCIFRFHWVFNLVIILWFEWPPPPNGSYILAYAFNTWLLLYKYYFLTLYFSSFKNLIWLLKVY